MSKLIALLAVVGLLAAAGAGAWYLRDRGTREQPLSGTIEADEVHVGSRYGGRVEKIYAREGDALTPGQTLVDLDAAELRARRNQTAAALEELEAGPRPEEISAALNEWQAIAADLEFARADLRRTVELFAEKTISETERDRARSRAAVLEKSVAAAESRYQLVRAGTRRERLTQARAQLEEIDSQLREMRIVAPTNCVLEVLAVRVGDVVPANREVATLLLPDQMWVRVFVPEPWLGQIKLGATLPVRVAAFPGKTFPAIVEQLARAAEFTPRNVQTAEERIKQVFGVKLRLDNSDGSLRAGMTAEVVFPGTRSK